ncbi:hypothetical protein SAMN05880582_1011634 [Rhizobium sp. RU20A]|uniref:hypothetical protein n=1 Tax=Rhizobium sp. RU20A TaxID=1907412 RepID=UPI000955D5BC|nr:hypothetical protein [Rhizobium sp. RU20A]SIQ37109.1 hypothetical protein SAMN05880582_1011634 [Rhizobium sp. RU20A]
MADFVAVIRRTVDGLSENVPDMRAKVYDKARGAVRRQLENMTPRPSDEMIGRQMAKLEQAIALVEGENAEALPPLDADTAGAEDVAAASGSHAAPEETETPAPAHPAAPEQGPVAAQVGVADAADDPVRDDEPAATAEAAEPAPSEEAPDVPPQEEPAAPVDAWAAEATAPWPQAEPAERSATEPAAETGDGGGEPAASGQSEAAEVVEAAPIEPEIDTAQPEPEVLSEAAAESQPAAPFEEEPPVEPVAAWSEERDDAVEAPAASPVSQDDVLAAWPPQSEADAAAAAAQQGEEPAAPELAIEPVAEQEEAAWTVEPARDEEPVTEGGGPAAFAIDARTAEADLDAFFSSVSGPDSSVSPTPDTLRDAVLAADHDEPVAVEASVSAPYESEHIPDVHSHEQDEPFAAAGPAEAAAEAAPLGFWPDRAEIEPVSVPAPEPQATPWDAVPAWTVTPPADAHGEVPVETHPLDTGARYDLSGNPHDLLTPAPRAPTLAEDPVSLDPSARDPMADWSWPDDKPEDRFAVEQDAAGSTARNTDADNWAARELDQILADEARGNAPAGAAVAGAGIALGGMANAGGAGVGGAGYGGAPSSAYADPDALPERDPVIPAGKPLSYRVQPKRRMSPLVAVLVVAVLALGGGGYAYYTNQQTVNDWAKSLVASVTSNGGTAQTAPPSDTPANGATTAPAGELSASGSGEPGAGSVPPTASGQTEVAAIDPGPQKFTQRLQADGTEIDAGPAALASADPTVSEGKSVAEKTDTAPGLAAGASDATTGTPPADAAQTTTTPVQTTPAAGEAASALPGEKMFLYEERLGQTSPTAIPGTAVWSVKEESPGGDAKPEPVIQAQITVPDRGLTALMTIKRNTDSSLPASHVIEFVFSVPDNFEGGSIDAVQRVAMKRTEQDRGDALIAVPAKITDDFYMIALNDFPEAVTTNLQLLESRSWIDIPITYRNGRRALLTLEKGQTGRQAFNTALQAWAKLPSTAPANGQ